MSIRTIALDAEAANVNAQIEALRKREDELQKLINGMQQLKDSMNAERLTLESKGRALEAERYPVNWLPTELLTALFAAVIESSTYNEDPDTPSTMSRSALQPPIILSQVCQRWRSVALNTPSLWSRILCRGVKPGADIRRLFVHRSGMAPLDVEYRTYSNFLPSSTEKQNVGGFFDDIFDHSARIRSITLECRGAEAVEKVVGLLSTSTPSLQSLSLSVMVPHPSFSRAISLLGKAPARETNDDTISNLTYLKLEEIPLFSLPSHLFTGITTLRLSFAPKRLALPAGAHSYQLRMSTLCDFLQLTPLLEDFTLSNTIPVFDTYLPEDTMGTNLAISMRPRVRLPHLKRFEWSYPYPGEIHWFITFFDIPALEKLDIWVEEPPARRVTDWHISGHHNDLVSEASARRGSLELTALRDLSLQCAGENTVHALRKFEIPFLERFEIINADAGARIGGKPFPNLPRLEYMLREPHLHHLTHLTLSHFDISSEPGRGEALLGYMPVLTSLSLDNCIGVRRLMEILREKVVALTPGDPRGRRRVKVCPQLEAISLWGCEEVKMTDVWVVVMARNSQNDQERDHNSGARAAQETRRRIRPLRKSRHLGPARNKDERNTTDTNGGDTAGTLSTADFCSPAKIVFLRLDDCVGISLEDAFVLKHLSVANVVYNGRGLDT